MILIENLCARRNVTCRLSLVGVVRASDAGQERQFNAHTAAHVHAEEDVGQEQGACLLLPAQ